MDSDPSVYQSLCNGEPIDLPRYRMKSGLSYSLVRALAEDNTKVFSLAQKELNDLESQEMSAIPSSFKPRDVRAALSVAREIGLLPQGHMGISQNFEADFVRIWSLSAQLDDLTFFDQLLSHAVRLDITPLRFPQQMFDAKSDAIRWDLYDHLAQRNDVERIKVLEGHWNFLESTLLNPPQSTEKLMESQTLGVMRFISTSITHDAWETFEWLIEKAAVKPSEFLVQMLAGVSLKAPQTYLDKMFEVFPNHHHWIFHFFDDADKSGKSTERLDHLLAYVTRANEECLHYLVSKDYEKNTTRRIAIAQYAHDLLQHQTLKDIVNKDSDASNPKKAKL